MNPIHKRLDADFERVMREEASDGLFSEEFYENVHPDDIPPPTTVQLFSGMPRDPYGCENPVSQSEEE
jgi:hypothetical protein